MTESDDVCGYPGANGPCSNPPTGDDGYCWLATHSDAEDAPESEPDGRGAPEGNDNATTVEAWSLSFVSDFLREEEIERVRRGAEALGEPESAKELARQVAMVCLEQFRRTGDERFLRRYESICDTFDIAPDDDEGAEVDVNVDVNTLTSDEKSKLDALFDREVQQ